MTSPALSKHLLSLKFMQRAEIESERHANSTSKNDTVHNKLIRNSNEGQGECGPIVRIVSSYDGIDEPSGTGRLSFNKFNSEIEVGQKISCYINLYPNKLLKILVIKGMQFKIYQNANLPSMLF